MCKTNIVSSNQKSMVQSGSTARTSTTSRRPQITRSVPVHRMVLRPLSSRAGRLVAQVMSEDEEADDESDEEVDAEVDDQVDGGVHDDVVEDEEDEDGDDEDGVNGDGEAADGSFDEEINDDPVFEVSRRHAHEDDEADTDDNLFHDQEVPVAQEIIIEQQQAEPEEPRGPEDQEEEEDQVNLNAGRAGAGQDGQWNQRRARRRRLIDGNQINEQNDQNGPLDGEAIPKRIRTDEYQDPSLFALYGFKGNNCTPAAALCISRQLQTLQIHADPRDIHPLGTPPHSAHMGGIRVASFRASGLLLGHLNFLTSLNTWARQQRQYNQEAWQNDKGLFNMLLVGPTNDGLSQLSLFLKLSELYENANPGRRTAVTQYALEVFDENEILQESIDFEKALSGEWFRLAKRAYRALTQFGKQSIVFQSRRFGVTRAAWRD